MNAKAIPLLTVFALSLSVMYTYTIPVMAAESVPVNTVRPSGNGVRNQVNLNLASTVANTNAGNMAKDNPVAIIVGDSKVEVYNNTAITPAQRLAVYQVVSTGQQSIVLGAQGNAIGGSLTIGPNFSQYVSGLLVPKNVSVFGDAALIGNLNLNGNLNNFGKIFMLSSSQQVTTAGISAANIINSPGGLITSILPSGYSGIATTQNLNLSLSAINNIVNAGTISSSGKLLLFAGGSISNETGAVLQAAGSMNLSSQLGSFLNNGLIASINGNVNFDTGTLISGMTINNMSGTIQAMNGAINVRDSLFQSVANMNLIGGDFISRELNLNSGKGTCIVDAGAISGTVNVYAESAHVSSSVGNLTIGRLDVSGDPYISSKGNLDLAGIISGPITYLVATAGGNIYSSSAQSIDTSSTIGNGGNVVLAAGVNSQIDDNGQVTLARSGMGGDILLVGGSVDGNRSEEITGFKTSSSNAGSHGGNITLLAVANAAGSDRGGHIELPYTMVVDLQGSGSGRNGDFTAVAEATGGSNSISLGRIGNDSAVFGAGGGGNVVLLAASPALGEASIDSYTGAISGSFVSSDLQTGTISLGGITTSGAAVGSLEKSGGVSIKTLGSVFCDGDIRSNGLGASGGNISVSAGEHSSFGSLISNGSGAAGNGGEISIFANKSLIVNGEVAASGYDAVSGNGGNGSAITLVSQSGVLIVNGDLNSYGGAGGSGGNGGNGGSVTLASLQMLMVNGVLNSSGGTGGSAETGRRGGDGGSVTVLSSAGNIGINAELNSEGGRGGQGSNGDGGVGGNGGTVSLFASKGLIVNGSLSSAGGRGGESDFSARGGQGGDAAAISLNTRTGALMVNGKVYGAGGAGGGSASSLLGAAAGSGGNGGNGAVISLSNAGGVLFVNGDINNAGGAGGDGGDTNLNELSLLGGTGGLGGTSAMLFVTGRDRLLLSGSVLNGKGRIGNSGRNGAEMLSSQINNGSNNSGGAFISNIDNGPSQQDDSNINTNADDDGSTSGTDSIIGEPMMEIQDTTTLEIPETTGDTSELESSSGGSASSDSFKTISYTYSQSDLVVPEKKMEERRILKQMGLQYLDNQGASFQINNQGKGLRLEKGNIMLNPKSDLVVETDKGRVKIAAGALVLVMENGNDMGVFNLHDLHRDDVQIEVEERIVSLAPGQQLVLSTRKTTDFDRVNPTRDIAYRNAKSSSSGAGLTTFLADFSVPSALGNLKALKQFLNSSDPQDQKMAGKIMKMAAISSMMSHSSSPFRKGN